MTKLWIDDLRTPPDGWVWAKTSEEAIDIIMKHIFDNDYIEAISFDHDLGGEDTTRPVVLYMCEFDFFPNEAYIHTSNPVGREWLEGMLNRYGRGVSW